MHHGAPARLRLCRSDEVPAGANVRVEAGGLELAVYNLDGAFYVTDDHCTHGPGLMSEGFIDGDCIECNFHQGVFNIKTGEVVQPPCVVPLKTYRVSIEDGFVCIDA